MHVCSWVRRPFPNLQMSCLRSRVSGSVHLPAHHVLTQLFVTYIAGTLAIVLLPLFCIMYAVCRGYKGGSKLLGCLNAGALQEYLSRSAVLKGNNGSASISTALAVQAEQPTSSHLGPPAAFTRSPVLVLCSRGEAILEVSMHLQKGRAQLKLPAQQTGSLSHDSSAGHLLKKVRCLSYPTVCFWTGLMLLEGLLCMVVFWTALMLKFSQVGQGRLRMYHIAEIVLGKMPSWKIHCSAAFRHWPGCQPPSQGAERPIGRPLQAEFLSQDILQNRCVAL